MFKTESKEKPLEHKKRHPSTLQTYNNLLKKWEGQFRFEGRGDIESILEGERCRGLMDYIEWGEFEANREWMKRFYNTEETQVRLANYTEHYAKYFTQYGFNFRLSKIGKCMEKRKRKLGKLLERKLEAEMGSDEERNSPKREDRGEYSSDHQEIHHKSRDLEIKKWQKRFDKVMG
jgi:hypothetical protein